MSTLPSLRVSSKERDTNDGQWWKSVIDFYVNGANFQNSSDKADMLMIMKACEGELDYAAYDYVLGPKFADTSNQSVNKKNRWFSAELRNYDILTRVVKLHVGERLDLPNDSKVVVLNPDVINAKLEAIKEHMSPLVEKQFLNEFNKINSSDQSNQQKDIDLVEEKKKFEQSYRDQRASLHQDALNFVKSNEYIEDKRQQAFENWVKVNRFITFKEIVNDDVKYYNVNPLDVHVYESGTSEFVEDAQAVVRRIPMTNAEIVNNFYEQLMDLKTKDYDPFEELEEGSENTYDGNDVEFMQSEYVRGTNDSYSLSRRYNNQHVRDVYHVSFIAFEKIGELTYNDPMFGIVTTTVDDTYVLDKEKGDISIKWLYVNQVLEGYKITDNLYVKLRPSPVQRNDMNNLSICKHAYGGRIKKTTVNKIYSIISEGIPYQVLVNIIHFMFEKTMNKNKDKLIAFPLSLVPDHDDWNTDLFIYHAEADSFMFYDDTKPGAANAMNGIKVMDASLSQYAMNMYNIKEAVTRSYYENIGLSAQRLSDIDTSAGKSTTEYAIDKSATTSRELFRQFRVATDKDDQSIIDFNKVAYSKGRIGSYIYGDEVKTLNINDENLLYFTEANIGIFTKDEFREHQKLKTMKDITFGLAQKGDNPELALGMLAKDNPSDVMGLAKEIIENQKFIEAEMQKANEEGVIKAEELKRETLRQELENQLILKDKDAELQQMEIESKEKMHNRTMEIKEKEIQSRQSHTNNGA